MLKMAEAKQDVKKLKGTLKAERLICVQIDKRDMDESGNYFYYVGFTTGKQILMLTAGKIADSLELMKPYNLGLEFIDKKLKIVDVEPAVVN